MKKLVGYRKIWLSVIYVGGLIAGAALEASGGFYGVMGAIGSLAMGANAAEHATPNSDVTKSGTTE